MATSYMSLVANPTTKEDGSTSSSDPDLVNNLRQLFVRARDHRRNFHDKWIRNYRLLHNTNAALTPGWQPTPRDSEIYPTLSALVGWMTDQDTAIDVVPAADPHSPYFSFLSEISNDLSAVIYSTYLVEDYPAQVKLVLWDAFLHGVGIFKSVWDNSLSNGYGNAFLRRVDPWSFYPDPAATSLTDAEYFVEVRTMSYEEIERRFPETCHKVNGGGMDMVDERPTQDGNFASSSRIMDAHNLGSLASSPTRWGKARPGSQKDFNKQGCVVYEYWIRENDKIEKSEYPENPDENSPHPPPVSEHVSDSWRVVVLAANEVLLDERAEDLWSHASHPYERFCFDDTGEFYGIALVDHLSQPQIYINRLLMALQANAELTGNPVFLESTNSGLQRTAIVNKPGQRLTVTPAALNNNPRWLDPPSMPPVIMQLIEFWISRIENVSGLSAIVRGATPTSRNAEGVLTSIQEAAFVRIRAALRNMEKALERSVIKIADLIIDNYTDPRIMAVVGPQGVETAIALRTRHFYGPTASGGTPLKYALSVRAGANSPTSRQARIAEADQLFALGAIDDYAVLEAHQYPHINEILKRKYAKEAGGMPQAPGARQRTRTS